MSIMDNMEKELCGGIATKASVQQNYVGSCADNKFFVSLEESLQVNTPSLSLTTNQNSDSRNQNSTPSTFFED